MKRIEVRTAGGNSLILVGSALLGELVEILAAEGIAMPRSVVTNSTVGPLYGRAAATQLGAGTPLELPDGEKFKRWPQVETTCEHWLDLGLHRRDTVMAVGGGVVTDTVGFAAAVYMRGIPWIAVPTTLLAMVDAAVGGKTGVNLDAGKNLVGCFWHPRLVVADVVALGTLPERELRAGLAEVVKAAWIGDRELLDLLVVSESTDWLEIVYRAVCVKAEIVMEDEREAGARKALNLGHTLGHALEAATRYERFLHGEAVAWGMRAVTGIAARRGMLSTGARTRLEAAIAGLGALPEINDLSPEMVLEHLVRDKKRDDLGVAWVLPTDDGVALDQRVGADVVVEVFETLKGRG